MNPKRPSRPIIIKLSEVKRQGENLKSSKKKMIENTETTAAITGFLPLRNNGMIYSKY